MLRDRVEDYVPLERYSLRSISRSSRLYADVDIVRLTSSVEFKSPASTRTIPTYEPSRTVAAGILYQPASLVAEAPNAAFTDGLIKTNMVNTPNTVPNGTNMQATAAMTRQKV